MVFEMTALLILLFVAFGMGAGVVFYAIGGLALLLAGLVTLMTMTIIIVTRATEID